MSQKHDPFLLFLCHDLSPSSSFPAKLFKWLLCMIPNSSPPPSPRKHSSIRFLPYLPSTPPKTWSWSQNNFTVIPLMGQALFSSYLMWLQLLTHLITPHPWNTLSLIHFLFALFLLHRRLLFSIFTDFPASNRLLNIDVQGLSSS